MKKSLICLFFVTFLYGCGDTNVTRYNTEIHLGGLEVQVIVIDSCEYLYNPMIPLATHKGNCKYCAERNTNNCK